MGSGQGKSKRASAHARATAKQHWLHLRLDKWKQFLRDSGVANVSVQEYYFPEKSATALTLKDYEVLLRGLWVDLIALDFVENIDRLHGHLLLIGLGVVPAPQRAFSAPFSLHLSGFRKEGRQYPFHLTDMVNGSTPLKDLNLLINDLSQKISDFYFDDLQIK